MTLFWTKTWDALAGVLFPTGCASCPGLIAAHDPPLCPSCWARIPLIEGVVCRCGAPLHGLPPDDLKLDHECGRCRRGRAVISQGMALGVYEGTLRDCVKALKYGGRHKTAARLARRLSDHPRCRNILRDADLLVGVPLHRERARERGFNQAELLARGLASATRASFSAVLVRVRNTPSQTDLSARQRRRNVVNAFAVQDKDAVRGKTLVLIDDVETTGATLRECARTLLAAGAREVRAITVARAE